MLRGIGTGAAGIGGGAAGSGTGGSASRGDSWLAAGLAGDSGSGELSSSDLFLQNLNMAVGGIFGFGSGEESEVPGASQECNQLAWYILHN